MTDIDDKPYEHVPFERGPTYAVSLPIVGQVVIDGEQAGHAAIWNELTEDERDRKPWILSFSVKPQPEPLRLKGYEWLGRQYVVTPIEPAILAHWWQQNGNDSPVPSAGRVTLYSPPRGRVQATEDIVAVVTLVRLWVDWEAYQPSPDPESVAYKSVVRMEVR